MDGPIVPEGPYVVAFIFCRGVRSDSEGQLLGLPSIISTVTAEVGQTLSEVNILVSLVGAGAPSPCLTVLRCFDPYGVPMLEVGLAFDFSRQVGDSKIVPLAFRATRPGLYWAALQSGELLLTAACLEVLPGALLPPVRQES